MNESVPWVIGVTGRMGMGKSTVTKMMAEEGLPVWSADDCVKRLYARDGEGTRAILREFGNSMVDENGVNRVELKRRVLGNRQVLDRLEALIHPLVRRHRQKFVTTVERAGKHWCAVEIPLLFETGADREVDIVVVVSAPAEIQRQRLAARDNLDISRINVLLSRQVSDERQRERADFVIRSVSMDETRRQVSDMLSNLRERKGWQ